MAPHARNRSPHDGEGRARTTYRRWHCSLVAWGMYLDGDAEALRAYHAGDRTSALVAPYFERFGIDPLSFGGVSDVAP